MTTATRHESYLIVTFDGFCQVSRVRYGIHDYCDRFYGRTHKADAVRYIKRVGGKDAAFEFTTFNEASR